MAENHIIRIQSEDDFIDLRAFSKHDKNGIENHFNTNSLFWLNYEDFMLGKYKTSSFKSPNILNWLVQLRESNALNRMFPSIENTVMQFIGRDIFNYTLMPQSAIFFDFSSFTPYNIDIIGTQKNSEIDFSQQFYGNKLLRPKAINKSEYKVVRIYDANLNIFIDLKTHITKESELALNILNLPIFLRDYHATSRTRIVENAHSNIDYEFNHKIFEFYNPSMEYLLELRPQSEHIKYTKGQLNSKSSSKTQFDFMKITNFLMFASPGLFLPLTQRETKWSLVNTPDITINVASDSKDMFHMIAFPLSFVNNLHDAQQVFQMFADNVKNQSDVIKRTSSGLSRDVESQLNILESTLFFTNETKSLMYVLEHSLVHAFKPLSVMDNPDSQNL